MSVIVSLVRGYGFLRCILIVNRGASSDSRLRGYITASWVGVRAFWGLCDAELNGETEARTVFFWAQRLTVFLQDTSVRFYFGLSKGLFVSVVAISRQLNVTDW